MLSPAKLRILVELSRLGTLRAVAERHSYSASSVSWQLAELEREVGLPLVTRVGRKLVLTETGRWLADAGARVLDDFDTLNDQVSRYQEKPTGTVRLAVFPTAGHDLVVPMVQMLRHQHPQIDVSVAEREPADALRELTEHTIDLAVVCEYSLVPLAVSRPLAKERLLTEEVFLAMSSDDPLTSTHDDIPVAALRKHVWLAGERAGDDADLATRLCALGEFRPVTKHDIIDYRLMLAMVASGIGIGFVPRMAVGQAPPGVVFRRCQETRLWRHILLVHRVGLEKRPILDVLIKTLRDLPTREPSLPPDPEPA